MIMFAIQSCPFCLQVPERTTQAMHDRKWFVQCACGARGPMGQNALDARQGWNRAGEASRTVQRLEHMRRQHQEEIRAQRGLLHLEHVGLHEQLHDALSRLDALGVEVRR